MSATISSDLTIDYLTYRCYEFNRLNSPEIAPDRWKSIFHHADKFEIIFKEKNLEEQKQ